MHFQAAGTGHAECIRGVCRALLHVFRRRLRGVSVAVVSTRAMSLGTGRVKVSGRQDLLSEPGGIYQSDVYKQYKYNYN